MQNFGSFISNNAADQRRGEIARGEFDISCGDLNTPAHIVKPFARDLARKVR
jgi:hypothetical protein